MRKNPTVACPHRHPKSTRRHAVVRNGTRGGVQQYRCKTCLRQWSATHETLFSGLRKANQDKIVTALSLHFFGAPIQGIASLLGIKPDTFSGWLDWAQAVAKESQSNGRKQRIEMRKRLDLEALIKAKFRDEIIPDIFNENGHLISDQAFWRQQAKISPVALRRDVRIILNPLRVKFNITPRGKIYIA